MKTKRINTTIDHFSINDIFWVQIRPYLFSFGFKSLPDKIHYTIAFNESSSDINFHVTKNIADHNNRPQIKIFIIDKLLLNELAPSLTLSLLNKILQPIDMVELKSKYDYKLGYISFDSLEHSNSYSLIEQKLIESFKDISKFKKKTRLKLEGDIEKRIETFSTSELIQTSLIENIVDLSDEFQKPVDGGMIISEENILQVIRINENWYTIRTDLKTFDLMTTFINPKLLNHLIWKTKRAIIEVKHASTYADTIQLNNPIRLIKQT
jgi:hypothetical protein